MVPPDLIIEKRAFPGILLACCISVATAAGIVGVLKFNFFAKVRFKQCLLGRNTWQLQMFEKVQSSDPNLGNLGIKGCFKEGTNVVAYVLNDGLITTAPVIEDETKASLLLEFNRAEDRADNFLKYAWWTSVCGTIVSGAVLVALLSIRSLFQPDTRLNSCRLHVDNEEG